MAEHHGIDTTKSIDALVEEATERDEESERKSMGRFENASHHVASVGNHFASVSNRANSVDHVITQPCTVVVLSGKLQVCHCTYIV